MTTTRVMDPYLLEIPCDPEYLTTARLFAGAVCRQHGAESAAEDTKLAISEAATALLASADADQPIVVEASQTDRGLRFSISTRGIAEPVESEPAADGTVRGLELARTIFPSLEVVQAEGRASIEFDVPAA